MKFVQSKGTSKAKHTLADFAQLKKAFFANVTATITTDSRAHHHLGSS
jgi:hypothetical protein